MYRDAPAYPDGTDAGVLLLERSPEADKETELSAAEAQEILKQYQAEPTPLEVANYTVGDGNNVLLKREDQSRVGSFKWRGARIKVASLREKGVRRVSAASAGNHAQGVALAARELGMEATIYVPAGAPESKLHGIREHGGDQVHIVICDDFEAARSAALADERETGSAVVEPYDDAEVMAGQGTVGLEILEQAEKAGIEVDKIFVPTGGGGLLGGLAKAVHERNPHVKVIGVQMTGNDSAYRSFRTGQRHKSSGVNTACDGTTPAFVGAQCLAEIDRYVHDIILVEPAEMGELYTQELSRLDALAPVYGTMAYDDLREPAGILAEVGAIKYGRTHAECQGETWAAVASGGNVDLTRIDELIDAYKLSTRKPNTSYVGRVAAINGPTALYREYAPVLLPPQNKP